MQKVVGVQNRIIVSIDQLLPRTFAEFFIATNRREPFKFGRVTSIVAGAMATFSV